MTCHSCKLVPTCNKAGAVILLVDDQGKATCVRCFTGGRVETKKR
jgi:hypothetical protein